jgi:hypothetical protein
MLLRFNLVRYCSGQCDSFVRLTGRLWSRPRCPRRSKKRIKSRKSTTVLENARFVGLIRPGGYGSPVRLPRGVLGTLLSELSVPRTSGSYCGRVSFKRRRTVTVTTADLGCRLFGEIQILETAHTKRITRAAWRDAGVVAIEVFSSCDELSVRS